MKILVLLSFIVFAECLHAQDAAIIENNVDIKVRARKRLYPGGRDEEPLRVQTLLINPVRKMGPVTDNPAADSENEDND